MTREEFFCVLTRSWKSWYNFPNQSPRLPEAASSLCSGGIALTKPRPLCADFSLPRHGHAEDGHTCLARFPLNPQPQKSQQDSLIDRGSKCKGRWKLRRKHAGSIVFRGVSVGRGGRRASCRRGAPDRQLDKTGIAWIRAPTSGIADSAAQWAGEAIHVPVPGQMPVHLRDLPPEARDSQHRRSWVTRSCRKISPNLKDCN